MTETTAQQPAQRFAPTRPILYRIFLVALPWIALTAAVAHVMSISARPRYTLARSDSKRSRECNRPIQRDAEN